jgi:hypothetical protein
MLHSCVQKFDVTENLKILAKFLASTVPKSGDCCDGVIVRARAIKPRTGTAAPAAYRSSDACRCGDHFESFARLNAPLVSSSQQPDRSTTTRPTGALNGQAAASRQAIGDVAVAGGLAIQLPPNTIIGLIDLLIAGVM